MALDPPAVNHKPMNDEYDRRKTQAGIHGSPIRPKLRMAKSWVESCSDTSSGWYGNLLQWRITCAVRQFPGLLPLDDRSKKEVIKFEGN